MNSLFIHFPSIYWGLQINEFILKLQKNLKIYSTPPNYKKRGYKEEKIIFNPLRKKMALIFPMKHN